MERGQMSARIPCVTQKAEEVYREVIRSECEMLGTGQQKDLVDFTRGARWGMWKLMEAMGNKDEALAVFDEVVKEMEQELKDAGFMGRLAGTGMAGKMRRILKANS
jgi:hypothetical protein